MGVHAGLAANEAMVHVGIQSLGHRDQANPIGTSKGLILDC